MKRRTILKLIAMGGISPQLFKHALAGDSFNKKFLVVISLPGGWDTTLSVDPWINSIRPDESELFLGYKESDITQKNNLKLGPALKPLEKYSSLMSIVNGIFLSEVDNGHDAAMKYMLTGGVNGEESMTLGFEGASEKSMGLGVIGGDSIVRGTSKVSTTSINGINRAFTNNLTGKELETFSQLQTHRTALTQALKQMVGNASNMEDLIGFLKASNYSGMNDELGSALCIASAFRSHSARYAELSLDGDGAGLDTHSNHEATHLDTQYELFERIKKILDLFVKTPYGDNGKSLLDNTTFMVTSEFSRTSALNNAKGKDHNPLTNSALFIGNGIKSGQTIGESKLIETKKSVMNMSYQIAKPYDFQSSRTLDVRTANAEFITPKTIRRTLCDVLNIDASLVAGVDRETSSLKALVK